MRSIFLIRGKKLQSSDNNNEKYQHHSGLSSIANELVLSRISFKADWSAIVG